MVNCGEDPRYQRLATLIIARRRERDSAGVRAAEEAKQIKGLQCSSSADTRSPRPNPCRETQPSSSDQSTHACRHTHSPQPGQKAEKMGAMALSHASPRCQSLTMIPVPNRSSWLHPPEHRHMSTCTKLLPVRRAQCDFRLVFLPPQIVPSL